MLQNGLVETKIEELPGTESEFQSAPFDVNALSLQQPQQNRSVNRREKTTTNGINQSDRNFSESEEELKIANQSVTSVFAFGIPKSTIIDVIGELNVPVNLVDFADAAEIFVTTKSHYSRRPSAIRRAERDGTTVHVLRRGTKEQIRQWVKRIIKEKNQPLNINNNDFEHIDQRGRSREAIKETEAAISRVVSGEQRIELLAPPPYVRRLQHGLAARNNLGSASTGREPSRRVVIRRRRR